MGKGSSSKTSDSTLSKAQAAILQSREELFENFFFPEFLSAFQATKDSGFTGNLREQAIATTNKAFAGAKQGLLKDFGRRGVQGTGVAAQGLTQLHTAKARTVAELSQNAEIQRRGEQSKLFQIFQGSTPTPTQSAPFNQKSSTNSLIG